jgi:hypothetical protein
MADAARSAPPALTRRISPVATALLILLACPCAAVNLYGHPSPTLRVVTVGVGLAALVTAYGSYRMFLLVDDEGVAVRQLTREHWLPWSEIDRAEIVSGVRGSETVRFVRRDGSYADVPPSLLQPVRPTGRPVAHRMLQETLRQIEARRPADR